MTHHHFTKILCELLCEILAETKCSTIENVFCGPRQPPSPTLSAQDGELDNLLNEPSTGWDDGPLEPRQGPQFINYGKRHLMSTRHIAESGVNHEVDAQASNEPKTGVEQRKEPTWVAGKSVEELEREEAELAKMDPPGPPMDEFGEFEQGMQPIKNV